MEGGSAMADSAPAEVEAASEALALLRLESAGSGEAPCSRNVLRKRRRWERVLAARRRRRPQERERSRARRPEGRGAARQRGRALAEERLLEARSAGPRLCVDLGVADRMTPKETSRLAAQIRRLYGANRRAERPFWLCLTELVPGSPIHRECLRMNDGFSGYLMETTQESYLDLFPLDAIVYLTPDSENVLEAVDPEKVYVLGGLVDESIHKNPRGSAWLQHQVETRTSEVKSGGLSEISTCTVSRLSAARPTSDVHAVDLRLHQCTQHGQQTGGAGGHYAEGKLWLNCHYRNRVGLLPRLECCI